MNPPKTLVHLTYTPLQGGINLVACLGDGARYKINGAVLSHPGFQLTGEPSAVTCAACRKSVVFEEIQGRFPR